MALDQLVGRGEGQRTDSRVTREALISAVAVHVGEHGYAPKSLAELAKSAGVSVATSYRYFASHDDAILAYVLRLPEQAAAHFAAIDNDALLIEDRLHLWNRAWVKACVDQAAVAVHLRSSDGFLARRRAREASVTFVCDIVEPLLRECGGESLQRLVVWNAISDPREVLDLHRTMRWSRERIARFITDSTLAAVARS